MRCSDGDSMVVDAEVFVSQGVGLDRPGELTRSSRLLWRTCGFFGGPRPCRRLCLISVKHNLRLFVNPWWLHGHDSRVDWQDLDTSQCIHSGTALAASNWPHLDQWHFSRFS